MVIFIKIITQVAFFNKIVKIILIIMANNNNFRLISFVNSHFLTYSKENNFIAPITTYRKLFYFLNYLFFKHCFPFLQHFHYFNLFIMIRVTCYFQLFHFQIYSYRLNFFFIPYFLYFNPSIFY